MVQATVELGSKSACLRCGDEVETGDLCERCDAEITAPWCERHGLASGPSGLCPQCDFEANAERCEDHGATLDTDGSCPECDGQRVAAAPPQSESAASARQAKPHYSSLEFPREAMVGSIGDLARLLAHGTEVPEEFYFAAGLTMLGALCAGRLSVELAFDVEPRLYTVLLGESYAVKKSTAMKKMVQCFQRFDTPPVVQYGVASAEGLARILKHNPNLVLAYDELQMFIQKSQVTASALLPVVTSLFEQNHWDNATKVEKYSVKIEGAHLSLLGCCTSDTYASMWTPQAIAIGFLNRLFIVNADRRVRVAWPSPPSPVALTAILDHVSEQMKRLPKRYDITGEAKLAWKEWYDNVPPTEHARRLDTIGFRLLGLIALSTDKDVIDEETVRTVAAILDYELNIRTLTDPIDADTIIAKLEEAIRRQLEKRGALNERALRQYTGADKKGLWAFKQALANVIQFKDVVRIADKYERPSV
jgi:hypothetical protein